ncbi:hypothetical protein [Stenotrophomonas sp. Iso1]|uniref:hypothetical protein n=1 Tax=Stenotrophomonas sp. Iso1 TaxID=2977283 RepID=UPI0022B7CB4D|nr:hypothetical protein [Stenotrophomonas sp. Iso1]
MTALGSFNAIAESAPEPATQVAVTDDVEFQVALLERARAVAASGQPLDLLVASRLVLPSELRTQPAPSTSPRQSDGWLDEAVRIGSDQPAIARAAVTRCLGGGSCDVPAAIQTLQTRESDEAVAQLLLWRLHVAKGDTEAASNAWMRATQATRYVDDYAEGVALMDRATRDGQWPAPPAGFLQGKPVDGETTRSITVFSLAAAFWMPGLVDAHRQCPANVVAERRRQCRQLFTTMADSSSTVAVSLGTARMIDLSDGPAERQKWEGRKRDLAWVSTRSAELLSGESNGASRVSLSNYLRWVGEAGELPATRQLLASNDVAAQPPADWEPPRITQ